MLKRAIELRDSLVRHKGCSYKCWLMSIDVSKEEPV